MYESQDPYRYNPKDLVLNILEHRILTLISTLRYEPPIAPNMQIFQETAVEAFPMAIVGFAVAFSVAKVYSIKHDYTIDGNQVRRKE